MRVLKIVIIIQNQSYWMLFNKTDPTIYLIGNVELIEGDGRHSDKLILRVTKAPNLQNEKIRLATILQKVLVQL